MAKKRYSAEPSSCKTNLKVGPKSGGRSTALTDNFTVVKTFTDNTTTTYADDNVTESGK